MGRKGGEPPTFITKFTPMAPYTDLSLYTSLWIAEVLVQCCLVVYIQCRSSQTCLTHLKIFRLTLQLCKFSQSFLFYCQGRPLNVKHNARCVVGIVGEDRNQRGGILSYCCKNIT